MPYLDLVYHKHYPRSARKFVGAANEERVYICATDTSCWFSNAATTVSEDAVKGGGYGKWFGAAIANVCTDAGPGAFRTGVTCAHHLEFCFEYGIDHCGVGRAICKNFNAYLPTTSNPSSTAH